MRLSTQPVPFGDGSRAESPTACHISRPNGSEKPAMGFHAAAGRVSMPRDSQPFHGKSLSLTVLTNIGELSPATESKAIFSIPAEYSVLTYSRFTVYPATTERQLPASSETRSRSRLIRSTASANAPDSRRSRSARTRIRWRASSTDGASRSAARDQADLAHGGVIQPLVAQVEEASRSAALTSSISTSQAALRACQSARTRLFAS